MTDMNDQDPVDALVGDARDSLSRARAAVPPDFAAVLARVEALAGRESAPIVVAPADDEASDDVVVDIRTRPRSGTTDGLDGLVADARAAVERMAEGARMRAIPPMPRVRPRRTVRVVAAGVFGLMAAAAAVTFTILQVSEPARVGQSTPLDQAFRIADDAATQGDAVSPAPERAIPRSVAPAAVVPVPEAPAVEAAPPTIATPDPVAERPTVRPVDPDRLRTLSDEARRLWRAGDRGGAEAKFLEVVRAGGRTPLAELAWGDLFALARQMGDEGRLAKRWRGYVAKFPRGRYADDARAGLCRSSKTPGACWAAYLRDFPQGSYRTEARLASPDGR